MQSWVLFDETVILFSM